MNRYSKNTPEGTRDIIYDEAMLYSQITEKFSTVYERNGFSPIITTAIEYFDVFDNESGFLSRETMYKLTDTAGRLLVLRCDNTTPIARVMSTKLKNRPLPQKIYYNQNIYRISTDYSGKRNEILQSGIEIIGVNSIKSDIQCLCCALEALLALGVKFKIELGNVGYYNALACETKLNSEESLLLRKFVDAKNLVSINSMKKRAELEKMRKLPFLYGGSEVFDEAAELADGNQEALSALNYVKSLYDILNGAGYGEYIMIDMGLVHRIDYYTGMVFRGYIEGAGEPVLAGGRYDKLSKNFDSELPSTGFAINVCACAEVISKTSAAPQLEKSSAIIFYEDNSLGAAISLQSSLGCKAELSGFDTLAETLKYAETAGIPRVYAVDKSGAHEVCFTKGECCK